MRAVQLIVNGEPRSVRAGLTVAGLVDELGLKIGRIAVEVNTVIVARERYAAHALAPDDRVEIVHFVGGG